MVFKILKILLIIKIQVNNNHYKKHTQSLKENKAKNKVIPHKSFTFFINFDIIIAE